MTAQILFQQLAYVDRLKKGGFTDDQARASAEALETAFSEAVATKADLKEVEARLSLEIAQTKNDILRWFFGFNLVMIGAIFTIVKFVR
jgi:hypothetical protein